MSKKLKLYWQSFRSIFGFVMFEKRGLRLPRVQDLYANSGKVSGKTHL